MSRYRLSWHDAHLPRAQSPLTLHRTETRAQPRLSWSDRAVTAGLLALIALTPFAFGAVHPWAFSVLEALVFLLGALWMGKLMLRSSRLRLPFISLALFLFLGLVSVQLFPLPPPVLKRLSPSTYRLYAKIQPDWPAELWFERPIPKVAKHSGTLDAVLLPTIDEVKRGAPVPFLPKLPGAIRSAPPPNSSLGVRRGGDGTPHPRPTDRRPPSRRSGWRPLSIAPALTQTALLKCSAYTTLFLLVLLYPFDGSDDDFLTERFYRLVLWTVLVSGLMVASVALVQRASWNGKILWFFVPYDWEGARPNRPHLGGPFINADHFANYLALILPLTLACALCRTFVTLGRWERALRVACGLVSLIIFATVLVSLSRGGWIGTALGIAILAWVLLNASEDKRARFMPSSRISAIRGALATFVALLGLTLVLVGPETRNRLDTRLGDTLRRDLSLSDRVWAWEDSLPMVRDFPLLGVGLGGWMESFPRYQRPPWSQEYFGATHNDYLQLAAETGLAGVVLLGWFFSQVLMRLRRRAGALPSTTVAVFAALLSALAVMALHEGFDFSLQVPANALLFTVLLALALRMATAGGGERWGLPCFELPRYCTAGVCAVVIVLGAVALRQEKIPYPFNIRDPGSVAEVRALLLSHPAHSSIHLSLVDLLGDRMPLERKLQELQIALWLDPNNPFARDFYAHCLLSEKREQEGLRELTTSVFLSPAPETHFFLSQRLMPWLSAGEQAAVEEGFKRAFKAGYPEALGGLAQLYTSFGRFDDEGKLYEQAAAVQPDPQAKERELVVAGRAYVESGNTRKAEALFRQAARVFPEDLFPYQSLASLIFAPRKDSRSIKAVIAEGIENGADPFELSISLAEAAEQAGDREGMEAGLVQALKLQPASLRAGLGLGVFYLEENNFDRAALTFEKTAALNPDSAQAFSYLGQAEEGRYRLFAAKKAYATAMALDPNSRGFKAQYADFERRLARDARADSDSLAPPVP